MIQEVNYQDLLKQIDELRRLVNRAGKNKNGQWGKGDKLRLLTIQEYVCQAIVYGRNFE